MRTEINGEPATVEALSHPAVRDHGHFTSMRIRRGAVRGRSLPRPRAAFAAGSSTTARPVVSVDITFRGDDEARALIADAWNTPVPEPVWDDGGPAAAGLRRSRRRPACRR